MERRITLPSVALKLEGGPEFHRALVVSATSGIRSADAPSANEDHVEAYRAVPFVQVRGESPNRQIVIGRTRVIISDVAEVECRLQVRWSEANGWRQTTEAVGDVDLTEIADGLARRLGSAAHAPYPIEKQTCAAVIAKELAEASRNSISDLRELRYELERSLADHSRRDLPGSPRVTLAALLELSIAASRARDEARTSVREGLWLWRTDSDAYHRHRKLLDSSILSSHEPADEETRPWMRLHDAAVRQCDAIDRQLAEESGHLATLLNAATTLSSAREADSQETFNVIAAAAAVGLGLPTLVFALYSANWLLPLNNGLRYRALVPVALGALIAAGIAVWRAPWGHRGRTIRSLTARGGAAIVAVFTVMGLLVVAGRIADPSPQAGSGPRTVQTKLPAAPTPPPK